MARNTQLPAHVEQLVLYLSQGSGDVRRQIRNCQQYPDHAVELIYGAICLNALAVLWDARAVAEAGSAVVTSTRIDFAEAVAHHLAPKRELWILPDMPSKELEAARAAAEAAAEVIRTLYQKN